MVFFNQIMFIIKYICFYFCSLLPSKLNYQMNYIIICIDFYIASNSLSEYINELDKSSLVEEMT